MPIIPRYQPRGGPSVGGLNYAGAYQPPGGEDWRTLAKAAEAAGAVLDLFKPAPKPAAREGGASTAGAQPVGAVQATGPQTASGARSALTAEDHLLGKAREVTWRREQLAADVEALDAEVVRQSRQQAAEALPQGARIVFETLTAPREAGFMAAAVARAGKRVREASQALSLERQALGVDEYHSLIETAPEQAMAALGSATGELAARLRQNGADPADIQAAQRELVSTAQAERVSRALESDPDRAAVLLGEFGSLGEADRRRLAEEIEAEQLRRGVQREVGRWVADDPSLADDPERLMALAQGAGEGDERLAALYQGSAFSEMRAARERMTAQEAQAWAPVESLLAEGQVRSWTDLRTRLWRRLNPRQQADLLTVTGEGIVDGGAGSGYAGLRIRTAGPPLSLPGDQRMADSISAPEPEPLSRQNRAFNLYLEDYRPGGPWKVDRQTGRFFRLGQRSGLDGKGTGFGVIYATPEEAQEEVDRRLGIQPLIPGQRSGREKALRKEMFGDTPDGPVGNWPKLKYETGIDWDFVAFEESSSTEPRLSVYYPGKDGSGPTVAHGFDIGVRNAHDLDALGLPPALRAKLTPYLDRTGPKAKQAVDDHPLTLSRAEADVLDQAVRNHLLKQLITAFDRDSRVGPFRSLPPGLQTAIGSLYYNLGADDPAKDTPGFWKQITEGDWEGAYDNLSKTKWDNPGRRGREAAFIRRDIDNGLAPARPPYARKPRRP